MSIGYVVCPSTPEPNFLVICMSPQLHMQPVTRRVSGSYIYWLNSQDRDTFYSQGNNHSAEGVGGGLGDVTNISSFSF